MVLFAFLGNTLFLTILVAMLSNTYTNLAQNATAEIQFRRAVLTFEGVKSDALFAYRPPLNVLAVVILLPLKFVLSPRWFVYQCIKASPNLRHSLTLLPFYIRFHKINVFMVRVHNAPILLLVSLYERRYLWRRASMLSPPMRHSWLAVWERFGAHGDLSAVFDADPPQDIIDEMDDVDDVLAGDMWDGGDYITALRRRRGSRSVVSEPCGIWSGHRSRSGHNGNLNGIRRRSTRDELIETEREGSEA